MNSFETDHARWNEEMARRYDPELFYRHKNPLVRYIQSRRLRAIHSLLRLHRDHRVLEVGCGAGHVLAGLNTGEKVGIDLSEYLLEKARERLGGSAELIRASAEDLPFDDCYFDRVVCSEVLEHLEDPALALSEIRRVLAHNGLAVVTVPNEPLINRIKQGLVRFRLFGLVTGRRDGRYQMPERMDGAWHLHAFDERLLRELTAPHFRIDRLVGIPFDRFPINFAAQLEPI